MIYPPNEDSYLLEKIIKKYSKNKKVLDIGSGSGIQIMAAINSGAKSVLATDINQEVVKKLNQRKIKAIKSNLFSKVKGYFDLIIFNPPYLPRDKREDKESSLSTTGGKNGDEIILKFLNNLTDYLAPDGLALIIVSSLTPKQKILKLLKKKKLNKKAISEEKLFMETLEVWKITKHL